jgi:hypothetical protein
VVVVKRGIQQKKKFLLRHAEIERESAQPQLMTNRAPQVKTSFLNGEGLLLHQEVSFLLFPNLDGKWSIPMSN